MLLSAVMIRQEYMSRVVRNLFSGVSIKSDMNRTVQPQKVVRGLTYPI